MQIFSLKSINKLKDHICKMNQIFSKFKYLYVGGLTLDLQFH